MKISDFKKLHGEQLENWIRWGASRQYLPKAPRSILSNLVTIKNRDYTSLPDNIVKIDVLAAQKFEDMVTALPAAQKRAFVVYFLGKGYSFGKRRYVSKRHTEESILRVSKTRFYELLALSCDNLSQALNKTDRAAL